MKLTAFQAGKGDCLLLMGADGRRMLVDGGMPADFAEHVAPTLSALRGANGEGMIDLVYVSHIDRDHIGGVLQLLDDLVAWRVHEHHLAAGNASHRAPDVPRPPEVGAIWHNAFREQLARNAGPIAGMLAASAAILGGAEEDEDTMEAAIQAGELAQSIPDAIKVSRRIGAGQLGIPLNAEFGGKLAYLRNSPPPGPIAFGGISLRILGPTAGYLRALRAEWNAWLETHKTALEEIARRARDAERDLDTSQLETRLALTIAQADVLRAALEEAKELGDIGAVTPPNLASLMLFAEEDGRTLLLTGDGHSDHILVGLRRHGLLDQDVGLHVNVLKVQHHGSEHNIDVSFCQRVTADDYLFCGNGEHTNPEIEVIDAIADSRLGPTNVRSPNPAADGAFRFWFTSRHTVTRQPDAKVHMTALETRVHQLIGASGGRLTATFLEQASFDVPV